MYPKCNNEKWWTPFEDQFAKKVWWSWCGTNNPQCGKDTSVKSVAATCAAEMHRRWRTEEVENIVMGQVNFLFFLEILEKNETFISLGMLLWAHWLCLWCSVGIDRDPPT